MTMWTLRMNLRSIMKPDERLSESEIRARNAQLNSVRKPMSDKPTCANCLKEETQYNKVLPTMINEKIILPLCTECRSEL